MRKKFASASGVSSKARRILTVVGTSAGEGFADGAEDLDGALGLAEPVAAAGLGADLLDGAGEVDVDGGEGARAGFDLGGLVGADAALAEVSVVLGGALALLDHLDGGRGHLVGVGAHDLSDERVILRAARDVLGDVPEVGFDEPVARRPGACGRGGPR